MNTHNPFSTFLDYWRQLQGWDSVRVPLWICTLWDARYLLDFWIKRCSRTTVYPHTIWSTSCSSTICTLLRSSCSSLVVLEEYTEELSLCRPVCITSVINWILPRADFVEHFFLLFLRLDHLFAGSSLLRTPANAKGNQMFPTIPYNHTVIFFPPQFYHSVLSKTPILIFCLWAEKLFSPCLFPPAICFFYFLRTGETVISPGWQTSSLASFHCVSFGDHLGVWKGLVDLFFFLQVDREKDGRVLLK